ncbi:MAG: hypothetical protein IPH05_03345 [Flavobacteriales bacterium]|nr:hypothetical protein [Flavobacteriales bacterium]
MVTWPARMVFYLTDSTDNFLYGALYFDARPERGFPTRNPDGIRSDMRHTDCYAGVAAIRDTGPVDRFQHDGGRAARASAPN